MPCGDDADEDVIDILKRMPKDCEPGETHTFIVCINVALASQNKLLCDPSMSATFVLVLYQQTKTAVLMPCICCAHAGSSRLGCYTKNIRHEHILCVIAYIAFC